MNHVVSKLKRGAAIVLGCGVMAIVAASPAAADEATLAEGKALFQKDAVPACAVCHTLKDAGASGAIGPNLDELQPGKDQILAVLRDGSGPMPSFAESLTEEQRQAVADYVVHATHPQ
ncbi:cytochrome c [uncultured Castellaniella sp.]|uniref:SorU family sulfite dehydrogenase c-type cytochrome subunit n=1 Tax=uncultured Castellaniella sp. TaxID=647907 RepID=UPI0034249D20